MKQKFFLTFFTLTISVSICVAQFRLLNGISEAGFSGGIGSTNLRGGEGISEGRQPKYCYNFGANLKFKTFKNPYLKIDTKFLFDKKGGSQKVLVGYFDPVDQVEKSGFLEANINLDYITFPINLEYSFFKKRNVYVLLGVYGSYLKKGVIVIEYPFLNQTNVSQINNFKSYDIGMSSGIGYKLFLSDKINMRIELISYYGILDISDQDPNSSTTPTVKNNSLSINIIFSVNRQKNEL